MTEDVADLGPVPTRIPVRSDLVRRLIDDQFPQWRDLPVRPVANGGWDNWTFHLGDRLSVRLPSAAAYALAVAKEHRWLPVLAAQLPLPISTPIALGRPGHDYPFDWSVYRWIPGVTAGSDTIGDMGEFGASLAEFLRGLQRIDPTDGPGPGVHNWFRGGTLETYAPQVADGLDVLGDPATVEMVRRVWQRALTAGWDRREVWFHGDVAAGNLLVDNGSLSAVIDFGTCGVGDPACDLAIAWTLLSAAGRERFRGGLGVDDDTWARGRGWALWKTLASLAAAVEDDEPVAPFERVLTEIITEFQQDDNGGGRRVKDHDQ
ncbi:aminoglycoside phosphotransferase family protein [Microlunatus soli]|uniref:Predicted kinase, aminoglycoside phosphotransferase (APT) family n=1 Tax=Microlunatus soli TaxID=630515 RepID=A0A1H1Q311_9ACTN|nr:aminoglycoside phosphotransferase family protein [Microlunatus soli]SDS17379.1 Predicted kinase, aminoglycoside phosphotransferase (APT) family [Microlunatus soli]